MTTLITVNMIEASGPQVSTAAVASLPLLQGQPWLEAVLENLRPLLGGDTTFLVQEACQHEFYLADLVRLACPNSHVVVVPNAARGPACWLLMAADRLEFDSALVLSANQLLQLDWSRVPTQLEELGLDAAVLAFDSLHPRHAHVLLDDRAGVVQAVDEGLISRHAMASALWVRHGVDLVRAAEDAIRKNAEVNGRFGLAAVINELVLAGRTIGTLPIEARAYSPLLTTNDFLALRDQPRAA